MAVAQLLEMAAGLEYDQLVAIADAVHANRHAQQDEVQSIRHAVHVAVRADGGLVARYGQLQRALTGLGLVQESWPHAEACEALGDALLTLLAPASLSREERVVLEWPWVSVCGPLPGA